jgi:cytochrome b561
MPLRNGEHGYGQVTKALHWVTLLLMSAQFTIGYAMDADAASDRADELIDAREEACESGDDEAEERCEQALDRQEDAAKDDEYAVLDGSFDLVDLHVVLGLAILVLGLGRILWRARTPLPPWDERLSPLDRRVENLVERALIATQLLVPISGLWLVLADDDALLPMHVAGHVAFFGALAVHVVLVLRRGTLERML